MFMYCSYLLPQIFANTDSTHWWVNILETTDENNIPTKNTLAVKKLRPRTKKRPSWNRCEIKKWVAKGSECSDSADGNKILIITIQAAKHYSYQ